MGFKFPRISNFIPLVINRIYSNEFLRIPSIPSLVPKKLHSKGLLCHILPSRTVKCNRPDFSAGFGFCIDVFLRFLQLFSISVLFVPSGALLSCLYLVLPESLFFTVSNISISILVKTVCLLGPTWIKLSQWASTRPDLIPSTLLSAIKIFHHHSPVHSIQDSMDILKRSFSKDPYEIFSYFEETPCGSGSIAQVHRAILNDEKSTPVAVKIIHPNVHFFLDVDLALLKLVATVLDALFPALRWVGLRQEISHLSKSFRGQADLRIEARNLDVFRANFYGCEDKVSFPIPIYPYVSCDVLVESLEIGLSIDALYPSAEHQNNSIVISHMSDQIISTVFASFLKMLLLDNFSHADLHPGNLLIQFIGHPEISSYDHSSYVEKAKTMLYKARAYFWPIAKFRASIRVSDLYDSKRISSKISFLAPQSRVFSPLEASPWLSVSSPLTSIPYFTLSLDTQKDILGLLTSDKKEIEYSGSVSVRVVFLDAGLITTLDSARFYNFLDLFKTLILWRDGYKAGRLIIERHPINSTGSVIDEDEFCYKMQEIVQNFFVSHPTPIRGTPSRTFLSPMPLGEYHIGPVLFNLLQLVKDHHVRLDDYYANLVMSVIFVEGLGRRLCPNLDLLPFIKQAALHYFLRT